MKKLKTYSPGIILFLLFLVISIFTHKDYGISWDEPLTRDMGYVYYNYVFNGDQKLVTYIERDHGSGFELPLICLEKIQDIHESKNIFTMRHIATHIFFLFSAFCGYLLVFRLFKKQHLACLAFLIIVLNPRLYAHSFFNSKDIPFFSMFLISLAISQVAFSKNKTIWYILLGAACGYTSSIRIPGIILTLGFSVFFCIDLISTLLKKEKTLGVLMNFALFLLSFCGMIILFWPTLWGHPVHNFIECYGFMSHFRWEGDVLFKGMICHGTQLPWKYLPVWFCISTPIVWLLAGFVAILRIAVLFLMSPVKSIQNTPNRFFLSCIAFFVVPILAVILLHSVVYDDWRHVYFIYGPFVILVVYLLNQLSEKRGKLMVWGFCTIQIVMLSIFMISSHPLQSVYFNELVSRDNEYFRKHYEMDYWGVSLKQGLEYVLAHDNRPLIKVVLDPISSNEFIISEDDRKRIQLTTEDGHPDYYLTTFRMHPDDYKYKDVYYERKVLNNTVLRVYKLPEVADSVKAR